MGKLLQKIWKIFDNFNKKTLFRIDRLKKCAIIDDVMIEGASDDPLTMTTLTMEMIR